MINTSILSNIILVCGPTAVGKTTLAIKIAKSFGTSIISADSRQCFKELNIGVAKPSPGELAVVPHYFIGSHSIHEKVDAAIFEQYALKAVEKIFQTNNNAIMVGGTGMYIRAFCEGFDEIPQTDQTIEKQVRENYVLHGFEWLQQTVANEDPAYFAIGENKNPQRLMRVLEVKRSTGNSILFYQQKKKTERPFNIIRIGLELSREILYERINQRVDLMITEGLVKEVETLLPFQQLNALQTVGYKEFFGYLNGNCNLEKAIENLKINTRRYAKRQMTWFKKDADIKWFVPSDEDKILDFLFANIKKA